MAKMVRGPVVGNISGSLGSVVFTRGRGSNVIRQRTRPVLVDSVARVRSQGDLGAASRAWGGLSRAEKAAWNLWAARHPEADVLGVRRAMTGREAYCRLTSRMLRGALPPPSTPPAVEASSTQYVITATCSAALHGALLYMVPSLNHVAYQVWVWAALMGARREKRWQDLLKLVNVENSPFSPGVWVVDGIEGRFGRLMRGQRLYLVVRVVDRSNGLAGVPELVECPVTA